MDEFYEVGTAGLWWLGQMGLIIKAGNTKICIDYFASPDENRQTPPPIPAEELKDIDANGVLIHHAGDTVRYEGMLPKIRSFGKIDVQLLPINGRDAVRYRRNCIGNMTYQEAADLAGETGSKTVIPGHWDMFEDNSEDPGLFADYIDAKYHGRIECRIPKVMEKIVIRAASSPQ